MGIDEVHEMGYTGQGIGVAICDSRLKPHNDLNVKEYQCAEYASQTPEHFHASAVTGILAGKQTGVAPDADVYFFAKVEDNSTADGGRDLINTFKNILERNKTLPDNQKIRVVSISGPIFGGDEADALVKELTASGVWVLSSAEFFEESEFGYLEKKDPMGDPNDFSNYQISHRSYKNRNIIPNDDLYVTSGDRTVPDPTDETSYRHDSIPSASLAIPVVSGYYVLACQADPDMTPEKFKKLAAETARVEESTMPNEEGTTVPTQGRTTETIPIKIIDIKALLKAIEAAKAE